MDNMFKIVVRYNDGHTREAYAPDVDAARSMAESMRVPGTFGVDVWGPKCSWGRPYVSNGLFK